MPSPKSSVSTRSAPHLRSRTCRPRRRSATGAPAASSPTCASRWRSRSAPAIPRRCSTARAPSSRRRSATTRPARSRRRGKAACRATPGATRTSSCATRLDELGRRIGGAYRVLVDANQHVDREAAVRAGVGFYGKNTLVITRTPRLLGRPRLARHATASSSRRRRSSATAARAGSASTPARPARSTSRARSTRRAASPTGRSRPGRSRRRYRAAIGDMVYGCDICQDVCPWNRGVERRRAGARSPDGASRVVSLVDWLERDRRRAAPRLRPALRPAQRRTRCLQRNALVALGNSGGARHAGARRAHAASDDELLARARRVGARADPRPRGGRVNELLWSSAPRARADACVRLGGLAVAVVDAGFLTDYPAHRLGGRRLAVTRRAAPARSSSALIARRDLDLEQLRTLRPSAPRLRLRRRRRLRRSSTSSSRRTDPRAAHLRRRRGGVRWAMRGAVVVALGARRGPRRRRGVPRAPFRRAAASSLGPRRLPGARALPDRPDPRLARAAASRAESAAQRASAPPRRRRCATSSAAAPTSSTRRTAARARSASSLDLEQAFARVHPRAARRCCRSTASAIVLAQERGDARVDRRRPGAAPRRLPAGRRSGADAARAERVARRRDGRSAQDIGDRPVSRRRTNLLEPDCAASVLAPLALGPRPIGMLAIARTEPDAFTRRGGRARDAARPRSSRTPCRTSAPTRPRRHTVDELRRLSALRADFVSLVSHELRSPMAAVIGAARTLHERWRELTPTSARRSSP